MKQKNHNNHMDHIEDRVLSGGIPSVIKALRNIHFTHSSNVSVKWDGAPSLFAGIDPTDGQFFIATKGIFNKNPAVYKSVDDINKAFTDPHLISKLVTALTWLPELGIKGIIQGDFLFSRDHITLQSIDNVDYLTFQQNTLVYAVLLNSTTAEIIKQAEIGVAWHTTYTGSSFEYMEASYGVDITQFKDTPNVWSVDAMIKKSLRIDMSDTITDIQQQYAKISKLTIAELADHTELVQLIQIYNNIFIRAGKSPDIDIDELIDWITNRFQASADNRITEKGKSAQHSKCLNILQFFTKNNRVNLKKLLDLQKWVVSTKLKLINSLNELGSVSTFIRTNQGFGATGAEGYVVIDRLGSDAVKIVDRMEFSYNNFSASILKAWDKPGR